MHLHMSFLKFIYSEKATKFCEISALLLSYVVPIKSKLDISQNFVAFLEFTNFKARNQKDFLTALGIGIRIRMHKQRFGTMFFRFKRNKKLEVMPSSR